jgi:hypothetical protein
MCYITWNRVSSQGDDPSLPLYLGQAIRSESSNKIISLIRSSHGSEDDMLVFWVVLPCGLLGSPKERTASILRDRDVRPEDGGRMFLRNVGIYLQERTALQFRAPTSRRCVMTAVTGSLTVYDSGQLMLGLLPLKYVSTVGCASIFRSLAGSRLYWNAGICYF